MKKILSLVLAALMIFSVLPAAFAADVETIANIEETSEYAEAIKFLNTLKVYKGTEAGDLAAGQDVHRWEAALFLYRAATGDVAEADIKTTTNYTPFKDIDIGDFDGSAAATLGAIAWATQAKITNGVAADAFAPSDVIIYQDAITMIVRLLGSRYTAASYPYGFVTTARELGITDGITGVGLEDEITRGVFAQLLYNAMFVEVDGVSLAEKAFDVAKDTVLITAAYNVFYEPAGATCKSGYVGFKTIDKQGEPIGYQYHAPIASLGLASNAAANDAVGTAYSIYHTGSFETIISARSLADVYMNLGENNQGMKVSFASNGNTSYVTAGSSKYTVVGTYSSLNNKQIVNTSEVKLYVANGGKLTTGSSNYFKDDVTGDIWCFDSATGLTLYAMYIPALDQYYREVDGEFVIGSYTDIVTNAGTVSSNKAFSKLSGEPTVNLPLYHTAYAKFTATDADDNGYYDRVTLKQYSFGYIDFESKKKDSNTAEPCFKINTANALGATGSLKINNTMDAVVTYDKGNTYDQGVEWARSNDYRWTGIDKSKLTDGYVLYYLDNNTKEIDVLEVISGAKADENDDTYLVTGYIRQMNIATNTIVLDNGETYTIGYNTLANSPLKDKDYRNNYSDANYKGTNTNLANNITVLQPMVNTYKTLVVVDNKVVYIKGASADTDFVIIDEFVSFEEDGIVAKAYTTVTNEYTNIKIGAYNGWNVGGFDYYLYFLSGLLNNGNYSTVLPFGLNEVYQVVAVKDGVYNLTNAAALTTTTLAVNEYGYITGTNGNNSFGAAKYKAVADNDFWVILDKDADGDPTTDDPKVYCYTGKLNTVVLNDVDVYKAKSNDYVIVAGDETDLDTIDGLFGGSVSFMLYNQNVAQYYNAGWLNTGNGYVYQLHMTNVLTGGVELVTVDPALIGYNWINNEWYGLEKAAKYLSEGAIYKVIEVDGMKMLYADSKADENGNAKVTPVEWSDVVAYYNAAAGYATAGVFQKDGFKDPTPENNTANFTYDVHVAFEKAVAEKIADKFYPNWEILSIYERTEYLNELAKGVVLYAQSTGTVVNGGLAYLTSDAKWLNNTFLGREGVTFDVYYVIAENGTAVAWAVESTEMPQ